MKRKVFGVLAVLLVSVWCASPLTAGAYELKLDETLSTPTGETIAKPVGARTQGPAFELALPFELQLSLLISLAIYLGWRFGNLEAKFERLRVVVARRVAGYRSGRRRHKGPKRSAATEQRRKTVPGRDHHALKESSDLARAKKLMIHDYYNRAEQHAISALRSEPYNLEAYIVALQILSKYQTPQLIGLIRGGLQLLRRKNPYLWREVAEQGRKLAPEIEDWDDDPIENRKS